MFAEVYSGEKNAWISEVFLHQHKLTFASCVYHEAITDFIGNT